MTIPFRVQGRALQDVSSAFFSSLLEQVCEATEQRS